MTTGPLDWLALDRAAGDLEGQIYRAVRGRVLSGQLSAGQRLPSTRALAAALGVARSTAVNAYERLRAEGFLDAAAGSATRVAALPAMAASSRGLDPPLVLPEPDEGGRLRPGLPETAAFPHRVWARCLGGRARALRIHDLGYGATSGLPDLRAAILEHVSATRGVMASPDQLVVVPSTGAAIDLLARLLLRPGDSAWIEEPGYPAAQALLREAGARLVPVPCDADGMDLSRAEGPPPRLIYVTPSHQYPTGATLSLTRRLALLDEARASGAIVLEDDYDSEFQYDARPIAALQGIDRAGCVAYLGTFSKVLAPGLRVAYAIVPPPLVAGMRAAQRLRGAAVPIHIQAALADFLREGHFRAHLRRMGVLYRGRMAATATALRTHCGDLLSVEAGGGGLQLAAWFRDPAVDDGLAAGLLAGAGFGIRPLSAFHLAAPRPGLLFGIARSPTETAPASARNIRRILDRMRSD